MEPWISDLTAPGEFVYRATLRDGDIYADAMLAQDTVSRDGRYRVETHIGRQSSKGRMGPRQYERGQQLLDVAMAGLITAATAAGWHSEDRQWCGQVITVWYGPAPELVDQVVDEPLVDEPLVDEPAPRRPALSAVAPYAPAPALPEDVPLGEISGLHLVSLRIALSIGPLGARERELLARVDAEIAARHQVVDEPAPAPAPAPRPFLPLTPRPFAQLAVRRYRMNLVIPFGYAAPLFAGNLQWYRSGRRRRPAVQMCPSRRRDVWRRRLRRAYWHRTELVLYWGQVA